MGKYGRAAIRARDLYISGIARDPVEAWKRATSEVFSTPAARDKGCPKSTFLGLCEEGLVWGVARGEYTKSRDNKKYALAAVALLKSNPSLASDQDSLWSQVGEKKKPNSQMDVVIALWNEGAIR